MSRKGRYESVVADLPAMAELVRVEDDDIEDERILPVTAREMLEDFLKQGITRTQLIGKGREKMRASLLALLEALFGLSFLGDRRADELYQILSVWIEDETGEALGPSPLEEPVCPVN